MNISPISGISIITIVLNGKDLIEETILSVITQGINDLEYIVIDGGSSDGTLEILKKYDNQIHKIVSGRDGGIYQAINKGLSHCSYPLIGIIHCGDFYKPGALSRVISVAKEFDTDVLYGNIEIIENRLNSCIKRYEIASHGQLKNHMSIFHPATFVKLSVYRSIGGYDCDYKIASDYDFFLNLYILGYKFVHVPFCLASFRDGGISGNNISLIIKENYRIRKNRIGVVSSIFYLIHTIFIYIFYKYRKRIFESLFGTNMYSRIRQKRYN
jgi:glycosyltransferase involved in cell wall biosynthesis